MHTSKYDYLINTLRFVSRREASQIYREILPECLTRPEMKECKAYKTYLGYVIGEVPPKGKRLKTPAKKSASKPATGIIIGEPPVETNSNEGSKNENFKGLSHDYPSGSGTVAEKPPSVEKITPTVTSEGTGDKPGVLDQENESEEQELDSKQDDESDDDDQEQEDFDQENESEDDEMKRIIQGEDNDTKMTKAQQGNENLKTTQEQVVEDAHVTISTVPKKTEVPVTSSSRSFNLASKFLNFLDIPQTDAEIVSPLDVHATPTPPSTIETTNPLSNLPDFSSVFRFNDRITALEKEVVDLKKDPLHTQVTSLVDSHLDTRLGETRQEFMNFLSESLTARIKEQVKDQLPQILPQEVSNFAPPVIEKLIKESRDEVTLAKVSSQLQSTYEADSTLNEFELKKILLDKMEKSKSYLTAPEHQDCYNGLKKSCALDKDFFYSYDIYSLKRGQKDKDKDEDPSAGSYRGLKKRKISKDAEPTTELKKKDSTSRSSKGTKSQPKSTRKSFKKPTLPQEPTNPDWNVGKTTQEGPTQNWLMTLAASTSTDKSLKDFDELISTPIDLSR
ncbi:hypothetical protein Tco_0589902 [Tanacetum coccineum]